MIRESLNFRYKFKKRRIKKYGKHEELKKMNIMVDPKMELLSVVELLSGCPSDIYEPLTRFDFKYKLDAEKYFSRYKNHSCVRFYTQLCNQDFSFDAPAATMFYLSSLPEMKVERKFDNYLVKSAGGKRKLYKFVEEMNKLAKETKFLDFFNSHTEFYFSIVNGLKEKIKDLHIVETLEVYYGKTQASYNIIPVTLFGGGYGVRLKREDDRYDIFAIVGPDGIDSERKPLYKPDVTKDLYLHEFGHSFVNPITEKFKKELNKYRPLFKPISDKMKQMAYGDWETCVNEHIIRAVVARMYFAKDIKRREAQLTEEEKRGFIYIRAIDDKLNEYERLREQYPKFEDFYPELIKVFENIYREKKTAKV